MKRSGEIYLYLRISFPDLVIFTSFKNVEFTNFRSLTHFAKKEKKRKKSWVFSCSVMKG